MSLIHRLISHSPTVNNKIKDGRNLNHCIHHPFQQSGIGNRISFSLSKDNNWTMNSSISFFKPNTLLFHNRSQCKHHSTLNYKEYSPLSDRIKEKETKDWKITLDKEMESKHLKTRKDFENLPDFIVYAAKNSEGSVILENLINTEDRDLIQVIKEIILHFGNDLIHDPHANFVCEAYAKVCPKYHVINLLEIYRSSFKGICKTSRGAIFMRLLISRLESGKDQHASIIKHLFYKDGAVFQLINEIYGCEVVREAFNVSPEFRRSFFKEELLVDRNFPIIADGKYSKEILAEALMKEIDSLPVYLYPLLARTQMGSDALWPNSGKKLIKLFNSVSEHPRQYLEYTSGIAVFKIVIRRCRNEDQINKIVSKIWKDFVDLSKGEITHRGMKVLLYSIQKSNIFGNLLKNGMKGRVVEMIKDQHGRKVIKTIIEIDNAIMISTIIDELVREDLFTDLILTEEGFDTLEDIFLCTLTTIQKRMIESIIQRDEEKLSNNSFGRIMIDRSKGIGLEKPQYFYDELN